MKKKLAKEIYEDGYVEGYKDAIAEFLASFDRIADSLNDYIEVSNTITIDIPELIEKVLMPEREKWEGK